MASFIHSVTQLVAAIRTQLSQQTSDKQVARKKPAHADKMAQQESLESLVQKKIKRIDKNAPDRGKKAFRIFLETILLAHFGENLVNDPAFYQMVDDVQSAMESDAEIKEAIDAAVRHLLAD